MLNNLQNVQIVNSNIYFPVVNLNDLKNSDLSNLNNIQSIYSTAKVVKRDTPQKQPGKSGASTLSKPKPAQNKLKSSTVGIKDKFSPKVKKSNANPMRNSKEAKSGTIQS